MPRNFATEGVVVKIHHALAQQRRSEKRSPLDTTVTCGSGAANREVGLLENHGANALRDLAGATRLVSGWLKGLPLQPLIAALTVALILGTIPLMLAALLSVGRGCRCGIGNYFSRPTR